ncbi:MAG: ADP-ribosylglycohydrolase family protein [Proteobacteria bacterium]|nr:ADP-ribosylglycohydrolase family protein [Pseudomonadota bacterium]
MVNRDKIIGGLWGAIVGDALGVPVEFHSRAERKKDPVTGMRGEGTFNLPPGSWSDDSSLMLCTAEGLLDGFNLGNIGRLFVRWLKDGYWTPFGYAFDVGYTTAKSIKRMEGGIDPEFAGGTDERDNGNGSLMRILPVGIYLHSPVPELLNKVHKASSLTHRHPRSLMACGFYCLMAVSLLKGANPQDAYTYAIGQFKKHYTKCPYTYEFTHFERILSGAIASLPERKIKSSGYVIHTLEASLWCFLTTNSFPEAVLKAINLGEDTDTTGIVTGGLAGIYYGFETIPQEWLNAIVRKDDIAQLFEKYLAFRSEKD